MLHNKQQNKGLFEIFVSATVRRLRYYSVFTLRRCWPPTVCFHSKIHWFKTFWRHGREKRGWYYFVNLRSTGFRWSFPDLFGVNLFIKSRLSVIAACAKIFVKVMVALILLRAVKTDNKLFSFFHLRSRENDLICVPLLLPNELLDNPEIVLSKCR